MAEGGGIGHRPLASPLKLGDHKNLLAPNTD